MKPLGKTLRNQLERTVREARDIAETAARIAIEQLGVGEATHFAYLSESERELRRRLRLHGRQLGDTLNGAELQNMDRLVEEVAYEHWHRMLFARFLAENNLLMYPDPVNPVPVTLEECKDLAAKEGAKDGWELAARFAARMLPQIFRANSPVFQISLTPEHEQKLEHLIDALHSEVFTASDSIGWVYQFWQAKKKDEVNAAEIKIGARELPAVTQLFTEPYMVSFLLDNSLGAWWATLRLTQNDYKNAKSEEELREKASLPSVPLQFLRFIKDEDGIWTPAAGTFDRWPKHLSELKIIDPCCGSGHFLVAAFLMLVAMRMEMEKLSAKSAVDAVLHDNLHGLEIDQRCMELAAFALALAAWRYPGAGGFRQLMNLNVACSGLAINAKKEDWLELADGHKNLRYSLAQLYDQFKDAPVLGSLINPEIGLGKGTIVEGKWDEVAPLLTKALLGEQNDEKTEMGVVAQGIAKAALLLASNYHLVITNVPYLSRGKQNEILRDYCEKHYSAGKNDLATAFLDRCLELCHKSGTSSIVLPQNWLFLMGYKEFREKLLKNNNWHLVARLGPGAFETISGEVVKAILFIIGRENVASERSLFPDRSNANMISGIDVSQYDGAAEKAVQLLTVEVKQLNQAKQLENPDARIAIDDAKAELMLSTLAHGVHGTNTKDSIRFLKRFWEIDIDDKDWEYGQTTVDNTVEWGGLVNVYYWQHDKGILRDLYDQGITILAGGLAWGKAGVCVRQVGHLPCALYSSKIFDQNCAVIVPNDLANLPAIWCFCSSPEYNEIVRQIDQSLKVTNATLVKVPFDVGKWRKIAEEKYPHGLPKPYSTDPTQWIFHGHPADSDEPLQVAVARLLGYRWPVETDCTIEISDKAHEWVKKSEVLLPYADEDGIICIPSVRGETKAEDRLEDLLACAYGCDWSSSKKSELLTKAGYPGRTLESWLRDKFFTQHCKLFHDRPFIWHVWDGLSDGFSALINYHKLDKKLLETLIYTYLGDWISRQKQEKTEGMDGAAEKIAAAEALKKRLELILEGETPYDIFVRWKPMERQPIGWNPDLNDGVRVNIRPFVSIPEIGKKGSGVLRDKSNINWGKDRGIDIESAPWFKLGPKYFGHEGDRVNDHHLSLDEKRGARENVQNNLGGK